MSDGNSTFNRRITKTCFRTCSSCMTRSQAPLYLYALRTIADRAEGTFVLLRYTLGGNRPSQTARLTMSPGRIHDTGLEFQCEESGISRTAPPTLARRSQSLPPILHRSNRNPISGYSKGSRGLSVFPRVSGVFTATSISPSPSSRQRPDRYKIRAGRNLPDKEFRYLRTVIGPTFTGASARSFALDIILG